jgi:predicted Holliday junction resolvase-like endonuclease
MFTNIPWSSYLTLAGILVIIWYLVLLLKFYSTDLKKILSGEKKLKIPSFKNNSQNSKVPKSISGSFSESFDTLDDAEELASRITQAVEESVEKDLSKEQLQNYLSMVLEEYPYVKISSLRKSINKLIVSESEKHPSLLLTLSEADSLWEGGVF